MNWSVDDEARVARLWSDGWTGAEIAAVTGLSRDAVISKVRRMGLVRALRFADEVATWGSVERAALAVGMSAKRGRLIFERMRRDLGWQAS